MSAVERLLAKREIAWGCWIFTGARTSNGYGSMRDGGRTDYAHRISYRLFVGPIPDGFDLDHLCRVRSCFNPEHLEPVTRAVNLRRGLTGAHNAVKTHCPRDHEYTPENTYLVGTSRACVACRRARYHARKAAA